jgi:hypothetical protein
MGFSMEIHRLILSQRLTIAQKSATVDVMFEDNGTIFVFVQFLALPEFSCSYDRLGGINWQLFCIGLILNE